LRGWAGRAAPRRLPTPLLLLLSQRRAACVSQQRLAHSGGHDGHGVSVSFLTSLAGCATPMALGRMCTAPPLPVLGTGHASTGAPTTARPSAAAAPPGRPGARPPPARQRSRQLLRLWPAAPLAAARTFSGRGREPATRTGSRRGLPRRLRVSCLLRLPCGITSQPPPPTLSHVIHSPGHAEAASVHVPACTLVVGSCLPPPLPSPARCEGGGVHPC
jgi:hypothetical protein